MFRCDERRLDLRVAHPCVTDYTIVTAFQMASHSSDNNGMAHIADLIESLKSMQKKNAHSTTTCVRNLRPVVTGPAISSLLIGPQSDVRY